MTSTPPCAAGGSRTLGWTGITWPEARQLLGGYLLESSERAHVDMCLVTPALVYKGSHSLPNLKSGGLHLAR